jgi:LmbE family N-acetylglucosaminyl deacetylase
MGMINHFGTMRVLVVAPHTDDEVACAGLMREVEAVGGSTTLVALSCCAERLPEGFTAEDIRGEWRNSCGLLNTSGILYDYPVGRLRDFANEITDRFAKHRGKHDLVICPQSSDPHRDHRAVAEICYDVFRSCSLLGWEPLADAVDVRRQYMCEIDDVALDTKVAVWQCYKSQHRRKDVDEARIRGHAMALGRQARVPSGLAEAYEVVRWR